MEPANIVLQGVVAGESGEFDGENDADLASADIRLEAAALLQILGLAAGRGCMPVIIDLA